MNRENRETHEKVLFPDESYQIQGAIFDVYRERVADFICYGKIIVELKAVKEIVLEHKAQLLNYFKAISLELGLLVNFGSYPKAEIVRITNTNFRDFRAFRG